MDKILVFGNSGSGKTTLAHKLSAENGMAHLDLDTLAWMPTMPPKRQPQAMSMRTIEQFTQQHESWVIEGCYTDLLQAVAPRASEIIFLNLDVEDCVRNAMKRPWEPHKYASKKEQDANLDMLLDFIRDYDERKDLFSRQAHEEFYQGFAGTKSMISENQP